MKLKSAGLHKLRMSYPMPGWLPIQHYTVLAVTHLGYLKGVITEIDGHFIENRCCQGVLRHSWHIGIQSHHRKYSPCRHCAGIIIAGQAVGLGCEMLCK